MSRTPLKDSPKLDYSPNSFFYISRENNQRGRIYRSPRQAYNLIKTPKIQVRTTNLADKIIFEYLFFHKKFGLSSDPED
jgi:hypothetical protein